MEGQYISKPRAGPSGWRFLRNFNFQGYRWLVWPWTSVQFLLAATTKPRAVIPSSLDGGTVSPLVSRDIDLDDGEFMHAKGWFPSSVVSPGVFGTVATLGTVAAGVAIVEAALIPGLLIGAAAVLVPRLLHRDMLSGLEDRLRRAATSSAPVPSAPKAHSAGASG